MELIAGDVKVAQKVPRFCAFHYRVGSLSVWLCNIFSGSGREGGKGKIGGGGGGGGGRGCGGRSEDVV